MGSAVFAYKNASDIKQQNIIQFDPLSYMHLPHCIHCLHSSDDVSLKLSHSKVNDCAGQYFSLVMESATIS